MFEIIYRILEEAMKDFILFNAPMPVKVESNLVTVETQEADVCLDFKNGKVENVWMNNVFIPMTTKEKYELTLLAS